MKILSAFAGLLIASAGTSDARAAMFQVNGSDRTSVVMEGEIVSGDGERFSSYMADAAARGEAPETLFLNSIGGMLQDGAKLAKVVRKYRMTTVIADGDECSSICTYVFAAG